MQFISTIYNTCNIFRRNRSNVQLLFQQFKNQGRHTVHTHMLVWLKEVTNIDVDHIRASVPKDNTFLAYLVSLLYTFCQFYIIAILKCQFICYWSVICPQHGLSVSCRSNNID